MGFFVVKVRGEYKGREGYMLEGFGKELINVKIELHQHCMEFLFMHLCLSSRQLH
jgi:Mn-dependent DtxR family transcriptional regulator